MYRSIPAAAMTVAAIQSLQSAIKKARKAKALK
jgi:hypothetical protein